MSWHIPDLMIQRLEFVSLAKQPGVNFRQLCVRFGISRRVGYKWLSRFEAGGFTALEDQSRRPRHFPRQCAEGTAQRVCELHAQWGWGGRKIRRRLQDLGEPEVPAASTCTAILHRAGVFAERAQPPAKPLQRFRRDSPNALIQLDFKGDFATQDGRRCYPLAAIDDHSRFNLLLEASPNQTGHSVRPAL